jgi:hypothetical protein
MKSYKDYINESTFDSFKVFKHKSSASEPDEEYDIRAVVRYRIVLPKTGENTIVNTVFPPVQLKTTNNKYDFNRHLNAYVAGLKTAGYEIVGIHLKGDPIYTKFLGGKGK